MAVTGTHPYPRALTLLLALLCLAVSAAPASAQHGGGGWDEEAWEEEGWDPGAGDAEEAAPATEYPSAPAVPVEQVPVAPPPGIELPARPWEPPAAQGPAVPTVPVPRAKIIKGRRALVRADGKAAIPRGAPKRVRVALAAANKIVGKPYKWGGGHGRLVDSGYDCSGTVGYSLIHAGLQTAPMVSGQYAARWGSRGAGRWITVYANKGHVYMEIAGLRLDTSPVGDPSGRRGVRWRPAIGRRSGFSVRHPVGL
jgi:cell wall-associated NlpC family hydrolase